MTRRTSLSSPPQKKVTTGLKRLQEAGITPKRWLQMLDADAATMQRLAAACWRRQLRVPQRGRLPARRPTNAAKSRLTGSKPHAPEVDRPTPRGV
jgi:hypothetical protein